MRVAWPVERRDPLGSRVVPRPSVHDWRLEADEIWSSACTPVESLSVPVKDGDRDADALGSMIKFPDDGEEERVVEFADHCLRIAARPAEGLTVMPGLLVHEWLEARGGSENVFEVLLETFPEARRFCLWNNDHERFNDVQESALARTPFRQSKVAALPLMPLAWRHLPAVDADWILCSSHLFAHHARFRGRASLAPKLVYTHTPARYIWVPELDGRGSSFGARVLAGAIRPLDRRRAQEATEIAANSEFVADRIRTAWHRESRVIYPPVDVEAFSSSDDELSDAEARVISSLPAQFVLGASRFVPYKRLDRVIELGHAAEVQVVLAGEGPDESRLRELAEEHPGLVTFVSRPSFRVLRALYRRAAALVFAPIEDFGIMPVEAMAAGTPVIANAVGGAAETVIDGVTGALLSSWSREEMRRAVDVAVMATPEACYQRASRFNRAVFKRQVRLWVDSVMNSL